MKNYSFWLWTIAFFGIGWTANELIDWSYFNVSKELSVFDAISLFVTIGLAFYVTKVLEKSIQDNRGQKEIYFRQIERIEDNLKAIHDELNSQPISYQKLNSRISQIKKSNQRLLDTLTKENKTFNADNTVLQNQIESLTNLMLYTPPRSQEQPTPPNPNISINNGIITYSESRINSIVNKLSDLTNTLFDLSLKINKL